MKKNRVHGVNNNKKIRNKSNALDLISEDQLKAFLKNGFFRLGFGLYLIAIFFIMKNNNIVVTSLVMAAPLIVYSYLINQKKFYDKFPMIIAKNFAFMFLLQLYMGWFLSRPVLGSIILFVAFAAYRLYKGKHMAGAIIRGVIEQEKERWSKK